MAVKVKSRGFHMPGQKADTTIYTTSCRVCLYERLVLRDEQSYTHQILRQHSYVLLFIRAASRFGWVRYYYLKSLK